MNPSPEAQLLTRYAVMIVLGVLVLVIGPRAFASGVFGLVLLGAAIIGTRLVYKAPPRFVQRDATPRLRAVWFIFLAEVVAAGVAFTLGFSARGSVTGAIAALVAGAVLEAIASSLEHAEYVRIGVVLEPVADLLPEDALESVRDANGPANEALKSALADIYPHVPTVVRAYLLTSARAHGDQRVLAVRFAYPWIDEDGIRISTVVFKQMFPAGESLEAIGLEDGSEARVRAAARPFYERGAALANEP